MWGQRAMNVSVSAHILVLAGELGAIQPICASTLAIRGLLRMLQYLETFCNVRTWVPNLAWKLESRLPGSKSSCTGIRRWYVVQRALPAETRKTEAVLSVALRSATLPGCC